MKKIFTAFKFFALLGAPILLLSCGNVLEDTGNKDTKEAIFYDAQTKLNARQYSAAIDLLESLGSDFLAQPDVAVIYASAYSGRCGLDAVNLATSLSSFSSSGSIFLPIMNLFLNGTDSKISDCETSEGILKNLGDETARTADENLLMGFSSFAKIGTILSRFADTDGDGAVDPGFQYCDLNALPDDAVREIGTGVALAITSVTAVGGDLSSNALISVTDFSQLDPQLNIFCTATDKTAFTVPEVAVLRAVIGSTNQGIGACPGDFTACICP